MVFAFSKCEGNIGMHVEQDKIRCSDVEAAREFTHSGDRVGASGGYEVAEDGGA